MQKIHKVKVNSDLSHDTFFPYHMCLVVHIQWTEIVSKVGNIDRKEGCYLTEQRGSMGLQGLYGKLTNLSKMCNNGWKSHFLLLREVLLLALRDSLNLNSQCIHLLDNLVKKILILQMLEFSLLNLQICCLFEVLKV